MHKPLALALLLSGLLALPMTAAADDAPDLRVTLKSNPRVDGPQVRLGDLFEGAGDNAEDIVAKAPAAGATTLFDASWLYSTARAHGLDWQPNSSQTNVRVERNATVIGTADLARQLADQLPAGPGQRRVELDAQFRLYLPVGASSDIAIQKLDLKPETGRFTVDLRVPAEDPDARWLHVSGRVINLITIPVLARPMMPGEIVRAEDITTIDYRTDQLQAGGIMDPHELIGQSPRHPLRASQPLRANDLSVPLVVRRNDLVVIILERPGLYLTAEGRALEDGGRGTVIRVANTQSKRTIDATVLGSGQVAVRAPTVQQALN